MAEIFMTPKQAVRVFDYIAKALRSNVPTGENAVEQHETSVAIDAFRQQVEAWNRPPPAPKEKPLPPDWAG